MKEKANTSSKIKEFGKNLKDWKLTLPLLMAIIGATTVTISIYTGLPSNILENVKKEIPLYQPLEYKNARGKIDDFNMRNEFSIYKGAREIEVPKSVSEAVIFVKENKETFEKGEEKTRLLRNSIFYSTIYGFVIGAFGILFTKTRLDSKKRE